MTQLDPIRVCDPMSNGKKDGDEVLDLLDLVVVVGLVVVVVGLVVVLLLLLWLFSAVSERCLDEVREDIALGTEAGRRMVPVPM